MPDHTVSLRNHTSSTPSLYPVPYRYTYKPEHYRLLKQMYLRRDSNGLPLSSVLFGLQSHGYYPDDPASSSDISCQTT